MDWKIKKDGDRKVKTSAAKYFKVNSRCSPAIIPK